MKFLIKLFLNAVAIFFLATVLNGVQVDGYTTAIIVAIVLGLLNTLVKPVLVLLTIPITILTLGLFLLIINAIIILLTDALISGFSVNSVWTAIIFSLLLSVLQWVLHSFLKEPKK